MLILQALVGVLRKSAGKVIQSIFGWAVSALFGEVQKSEKTLLSAVLGAVALWPILLGGIAFPKVAAFVLALVPIPKWVSGGILRVVWLALALLVPLTVGLVLQRREGGRAWGVRGLMAGFPLTLGLSAAFTLAFFGLPFQKLRAAARREAEEHITLIVEEASLDAVVAKIREALDADGLAVAESQAPWLARAISAVLRATAAIVGKKPDPPRFFRGPDLALTVYPHGATVRGLSRATARAHALIAGTATGTEALQTTDASAQEVERKIKIAWRNAGEGRANAAEVLGDIVALVSTLDCPYEDWEIVYRECMQLGFVLHGIGDPIAPRADARQKPNPRAARRSARIARRARRLTREKTAATAAKTVSQLARKVAERLLSATRAR
ncbi:MAG: hypothetical protein ABI968_08560 [Acidobacteriota bacterium]